MDSDAYLPFSDPAPDVDDLALEQLTQAEADDVTAENEIWIRRLSRCACAVRMGPGAVTALASCWPGVTPRRIEVIGRAAMIGLADLVLPDLPVGVLDWCLALGVEMRCGMDARQWLEWAIETNAGLKQIKLKAGLAVPSPGPAPFTVTCPACGQVIDASEQHIHPPRRAVVQCA